MVRACSEDRIYLYSKDGEAYLEANLCGVVFEINLNEDGDSLVTWTISDTKKQDVLISAFDFHKLQIIKYPLLISTTAIIALKSEVPASQGEVPVSR